LAGPGELARRRGADGRGGLRGGQRGGQALGVALPAGAAMSSRGGSTRGARGTERCPRDLMLGLVRTRQFADRHRHVPPGWGVTGGDGGAWGKVLDGWGEHFMAGGRNGGVSCGVGWGHGYILGDKHYTQSNGGASRMASPPSTLDRYIYIYIHVISPPWGTTAGADAW
jgi:hypothetical protein